MSGSGRGSFLGSFKYRRNFGPMLWRWSVHRGGRSRRSPRNWGAITRHCGPGSRTAERAEQPGVAKEVGDAHLAERIRTIHTSSGNTYGSPRVHAELRAAGTCVNRKRGERIMREHRIVGRHHRPRACGLAGSGSTGAGLHRDRARCPMGWGHHLSAGGRLVDVSGPCRIATGLHHQDGSPVLGTHTSEDAPGDRLYRHVFHAGCRTC
jgi:hypothetical protein